MLLYSSALWSWTKAIARSIRTWDNFCLRRMLGSRRNAGETFVQHIQRATLKARRLQAVWGFTPVLEQALQRTFRLAEQLRGLQDAPCVASHPLRSQQLFGAVLCSKGRLWWRTVQFLRGAGDRSTRRRLENVRHDGPGRQRYNWETIFEMAFGPEWHDKVMLKDYRAYFQDFLNSAPSCIF